MDHPGTRALTSQIADDLGWLEAHDRERSEQAAHAGRLHLAAALVRDLVGPFLEGRPAVPVHVAVVGGAGAGKSTVANLLTGSPAAEANPQAGFTRHPVAYVSTALADPFPPDDTLLGPLRRIDAGPSSLDHDVYQIRRVPPGAGGLPPDFVVWDCPDMTTWAASGYIPRLLEVSALADMLVYVASDERYNDAVPTQFLDLLVESGKPVVVCLVKVREDNLPALRAHFQEEVLSRLGGRVVTTLAIPHLSRDELADPAHAAPRYRVPLINQVMVLGRPAAAARRRAVEGALVFLTAGRDRLFAVARHDADALASWQDTVRQGQAEFNGRYAREALTGARFRHFDEAMVRLIEMLDLPGVGKHLSNALWVIRSPYRWLRSLASKALSRPETPALAEQTVLEQAFAGWLDLLRKEAVRRADTHPVWAHVAEGFQRDRLADEARARFQEGLRAYQAGLAADIDSTARAIYTELEKKPVLLNALRGGKLALDAAGIAAAIIAGGPGLSDLILVPLAASVTHQLVELLGQQYVEGQREHARLRQQALMVEHLSRPLADWLIAWPATGGSSFERLQLALTRLPGSLDELHRLTQARLRETAAASVPAAPAAPAALPAAVALTDSAHSRGAT